MPLHQVLDLAKASSIPSGLCALGVMTKAPRAGSVKTRLTPPLTAEEAAGLNSCFLIDTATALELAARNGKAAGIGIYTPIGAESAWENILPTSFKLVPQRGDAFGERLIFATLDLLDLGFASTCLIDSDSPTVPTSAYSEAVEMLSKPGDRIVLGPSDDGGYYLIGMKQLHSRVFEEIDWSTELVLSQTIERANQIGAAVHLLPTWYDVDDRATLRRLCDEIFGSNGRVPVGGEAPHTRAFLERILAAEGRERIWPNE